MINKKNSNLFFIFIVIIIFLFVFISILSADNILIKTFEQAEAFQKKNDFLNANKIYLQIFNQDGIDPVKKSEIAFKIAENYTKLGDVINNRRYLILAIKFESKDIKSRAYYKLAESFFYDKKNLKKSLRIYEFALKNFYLKEEDEKTNFNLGILFQDLDTGEHAYRHWKKFLVSFPESKYIFQVKLYLGKIANREKRFMESAKYLNEIISSPLIKSDSAPSVFYAEVFLELAYSLNNQKKYKEAVAVLENYMEMFPDNFFIPKIFMAIGEIYEKTDKSKARQYYQKIVEIFSDSSDAPNALLKMAKIDYDNGEYNLSSENLVKLINDYNQGSIVKDAMYFLIEVFFYFAKDIKVQDIKLMAGDYYYVNKAFTKALKEYISFLNSNPKCQKRDEILFKAGLCFIELNNYSKAWGFLEEIQENYPQSIFIPESILIMAEYLFKNNNFIEAGDMFSKYCTQFPFSDKAKEIKLKTAYCYYQAGFTREAVNIYQELLKEDPESQEAAKGIADIYFEEEKYRLANEVYNKILLKKIPSETEANITLKTAECLLKLGNYKKAIDICNSYLQKNKNNSIFKLKLGNIYKTLGQYDTALSYYENYAVSTPIDSTNAVNFIGYADSLYYQKRFSVALQLYDTLANFNMYKKFFIRVLGKNSCYGKKMKNP
ncbi:tetratricopeptide repeat protein [Candidatus Desantisbacteria bacterium]|nr:tetratricopeptide repeat protein [Candidatus Desantisbacteria bacterium]